MPDQSQQPRQTVADQGLSRPTLAFVLAIVGLGVGLLVMAAVQWPAGHLLRFAFYAAVAVLASGLKVRFENCSW